MKNYAGYVGLVAVLAAMGCKAGEAEHAGAQAGSAAEHLGRGSVNAVESAGHGIVYGARELGQSMSGTQGNPQAEQLSQDAHARMERDAKRAQDEFRETGRALEGEPAARGGGPATPPAEDQYEDGGARRATPPAHSDSPDQR